MSDIKGGASQAHVPASCHSNSEAISDETSLEPWWLPNQIAHVQISGRVTRRCNYRVLLFSGAFEKSCTVVMKKQSQGRPQGKEISPGSELTLAAGRGQGARQAGVPRSREE